MGEFVCQIDFSGKLRPVRQVVTEDFSLGIESRRQRVRTAVVIDGEPRTVSQRFLPGFWKKEPFLVGTQRFVRSIKGEENGSELRALQQSAFEILERISEIPVCTPDGGIDEQAKAAMSQLIERDLREAVTQVIGAEKRAEGQPIVDPRAGSKIFRR